MSCCKFIEFNKIIFYNVNYTNNFKGVMDIIKYKDVFRYSNSDDKVVVYTICGEDDGYKTYCSQETIALVEKFRDTLQSDEKKVFFKIVEVLNREFKNNSGVFANLKDFFKDDCVEGQEDVFALKVSNSRDSAIILKTSDFGTNLSYTRIGMKPENINQDDVDDILTGLEFMDLITKDLKKANILLEESFLNENIPVNPVVSGKVKNKF